MTDISEYEIAQLLQEFYTKDMRDVVGSDDGANQFIIDQLDPSKVDERLDQVERATHVRLPAARVLDLGAGFGSVVLGCRARHIKCYGVEPEAFQLQVIRKRMDLVFEMDMVVSQGIGEQLPFKDNIFDLITSFQVLEHTHHPGDVVREAFRVLRPGGALYLVVPNYHSFWEGHYGLPWMPWMTKAMAKVYVRALGRDHNWLDHLEFVTPKHLRQILSTIDGIEVVDWGQQLWTDRMNGKEAIPVKWGQTRKVARWVNLVRRLRLTRVATFVGRKMDFYYPIVLVCKKH